MYITIKGGDPTAWYSCHQGVKYKVVHEGQEGYLVESNAMGEAWRIVKKDDCEKTDGKLFCQQVKQDAHYDNTHGSLYLIGNQLGLNAWEQDILKRIARCRKKGQFKEDLEKTKRVIDLYLKEYESMDRP